MMKMKNIASAVGLALMLGASAAHANVVFEFDQVGGTVTFAPVLVTNGLFAVTLDLIFTPLAKTKTKTGQNGSVLDIGNSIPFRLPPSIQQVINITRRSHMQSLGDPLDRHTR